jgi:thymidylate synthase
MRIYLNCNEAITDIGRELKKCSTTLHPQTYQNKIIKDDPLFDTKEIQAFQFMIINTDDKDQMPNVTPEWCKEEFKERISQRGGVNPGEAYKLRPEVWNQFLVEKTELYDDDDDGGVRRVKKFDYNYNERISWQIPSIIEELRIRPETRQAIIEVHNNINDLKSLGGRERIPCSMFYQFMVRDGKLDVLYVMRSSDFATHFTNDIWQADELRRFIASQVGLPIGKFIMTISSLHIYAKDWSELKNY